PRMPPVPLGADPPSPLLPPVPASPPVPSVLPPYPGEPPVAESDASRVGAQPARKGAGATIKAKSVDAERIRDMRSTVGRADSWKEISQLRGGFIWWSRSRL